MVLSGRIAALLEAIHMNAKSPNRGLNTRRLSPTTRKASGVFGACARADAQGSTLGDYWRTHTSDQPRSIGSAVGFRITLPRLMDWRSGASIAGRSILTADVVLG